MATQHSFLKEIEHTIAKDPNSDVAKHFKNALDLFVAQSKLGRIPSIDEFSDLLHEVTTHLEQNLSNFDRSDLSLLKLSDKLTIYFDKEDEKNEFPKLGVVEDIDRNGGTGDCVSTLYDIDQATNTLKMTKYDIFNCLLIGCRIIFGGISNDDIKHELEDKETEPNDETERKNGKDLLLLQVLQR